MVRPTVPEGKAYAGVGYTRVSTALPDARCCRLSGPDTAIAPTAGGRIDGVTGVFATNIGTSYYYWPAMRGGRVQVEAAASFSAGSYLRTDADGRVRSTIVEDERVLRALEGSGGAGSLVWCVFV